METTYTDIAVLGGGAAGLAAAVFAARTLKNKKGKVTVAEKNSRVGKKLLSTGNGRCNLAHKPLDFEHYYGERALVRKIITKSAGYEKFFNSLGVYCTADAEGRVYPHSRNASAVLDALRLECAALGVTEQVGFDCIRIEPLIEGFKIISENTGCISARRLIITCGGMAGVSGGVKIYGMLKELGMDIVPPLPSLCPVKVSQSTVRSIKGLRTVAKCSAILDGKIIKSETGEVQFGENHLSGICIMNLSRLASLNGEKMTISLDLAPAVPHERLRAFIGSAVKIRETAPLEDLLTGLLHKKLAAVLLKQVTELPLSCSCKALTAIEAEKLVLLIKDWQFSVASAELNDSVWQSAQCTAGGVPAKELDDGLMSIKRPNLYFAGEVINVDGDCGGYNLAWAWLSGEVAGISAAESLLL